MKFCPECEASQGRQSIVATIQDSAVVGDVNITQISGRNSTCEICNASNLGMNCIKCSTPICEICNPYCRVYGETKHRFDSGKGAGPFCAQCVIIWINDIRTKEELRYIAYQNKLATEKAEAETADEKAAEKRAQEEAAWENYWTKVRNLIFLALSAIFALSLIFQISLLPGMSVTENPGEYEDYEVLAIFNLSAIITYYLFSYIFIKDFFRSRFVMKE